MSLFALPCLRKEKVFILVYPTTHLIIIKKSFYNMVQMCKRTQRGTLKPPILVGNLHEVDATDELSNMTTKLKKSFQYALM
jgi:hypothetical protein